MFTGNNIRAEMARNRMTNKDTYSLLKISDNSFRKKMNAEVQFDLSELCIMADKFNVSIDYLAERERPNNIA